MPAGTLPAQRGPRSTARGPFISGRYSYSISIPARVCDPPRPTARGYVHQGRPPGRAAHGPPGATRAQLDGHQENRIKAHGPRPGAGLRAQSTQLRELWPPARAPPGRSSRARPGGHQAPATAHATRTTAHGPRPTGHDTAHHGPGITGHGPRAWFATLRRPRRRNAVQWPGGQAWRGFARRDTRRQYTSGPFQIKKHAAPGIQA